jgi:hypothetical protein
MLMVSSLVLCPQSPIFGEPGEPLPNVKMWSRSTVAADYPMTHPVEEVVDLIQQVFELEEPPIYRCVAKGDYASRRV